MEKIGRFTYEPAPFDAITSDTLLLAGFIPPLYREDNLIDLGTGSGALPLILLSKNKDITITGLEIQSARVDSARRNAQSNGLCGSISIVEGDYRRVAKLFPRGAFTHVISNPPYIKSGCGRSCPEKGRNAARSEVYGGLSDLIGAAEHLIGESGRFFIIFTASRVEELLRELNNNALWPLRMRFIHPKKGKAASRVLVEAVAGVDVQREPMLERPIILS
jgi:tRNA1Val (adenine37-N6)-methyltransferase